MIIYRRLMNFISFRQGPMMLDLRSIIKSYIGCNLVLGQLLVLSISALTKETFTYTVHFLSAPATPFVKNHGSIWTKSISTSQTAWKSNSYTTIVDICTIRWRSNKAKKTINISNENNSTNSSPSNKRKTKNKIQRLNIIKVKIYKC